MNKAFMLKLADLLEILPSERFNMDYWFSYVSEDDFGKPTYESSYNVALNNCGTAGCVAGWTMALANDGVYDFEAVREVQDGMNWLYFSDMEDMAANHLGLTHFEAQQLFHASNDSNLWVKYGKELGLDSKVHKYYDDYDIVTYQQIVNTEEIDPAVASVLLRGLVDGRFKFDKAEVFRESNFVDFTGRVTEND
jgi:hypothetical protein